MVIPSWNGIGHLRRCLPTLYAAAPEATEVVVVDNGSTDGSVEWLGAEHPDVKVIALPDNEGYAEANNIGVRECTGDVVLLLNNDTEVEPDALKRLLEVFEDPTVGACQAMLMIMQTPELVDSAGSFLTATGVLYHFGHRGPRPAAPEPFPVFSAKGAALAVRKRAIDEVGLFDPRYVFYFEETDLCWRLWLAGWRVVVEPRATVLHALGATSEALPSPLVQYHSFKNRICTIAANTQPRTLARMLPLHLVLCLGIALVWALKGQPKLAWAVLKGIGWNAGNLRYVLAKRRRTQRMRRWPDRDFLPALTRKVPPTYFVALARGLETWEDPPGVHLTAAALTREAAPR